MDKKQTLFTHVYERLQKQIISGQFLLGEQLPSIKSLSSMYHVSPRTIRDVLHRLREEGFIQTAERKRAVVLYQSAHISQDYMGIREILRHEFSILDVFQTMEYLLPPILAFSDRTPILDDLEYGAHPRKKNIMGRWREASLLIHKVLHATGNHLFNDLYAGFELYAQVPFLMDYQYPLSEYIPYNGSRDISWVINSLKKQDAREVLSLFTESYHAITVAARKSFATLTTLIPDVVKEKQSTYSWHADKSSDQYYKQITREILEKIMAGQYPAGSLLPSETHFSQLYGVSVSTVRKAITLLNTLGFCQTYHGLGSEVLYRSKQAAYRNMTNMAIREDILRYMSALQLMVFAIHPAAYLAFDQMDTNIRRQLHMKIKILNPMFLQTLLQCILDHLPLQPLKVILEELMKLLSWGLCLASGRYGSNRLNLLILQALRRLQENNKLGFADSMSECYGYILSSSRDLLVKEGIMEAACIKTPTLFSRQYT